MKELLKNRLFRISLSTVVFGVVFALISFLDNGEVKIGVILTAMVIYFLALCLARFIEMKLGRNKEDR